MLIYNSAKEFIGIDENDLKVLGFSNLSQLQSESADFADLFVRAPGYVHNFQHVHWIDFVACAESTEESKVIISTKSKSYTANLSITKAYLSDNSSAEAYFIFLNNLRALSSQENDSIASEIINKPTPVAVIDEAQHEEIIPNEPILEDTFDATKDSYESPDTPLDVALDIDFEDEEVVHEPVEIPDVEITPTIQESVTSVYATPAVQLDYPAQSVVVDDDDGYVFDPKVASEELGLPVDLIEEFIQDFVAQAQEFKADMYSFLQENDIDNVAILSHKLKGVAANLRIENALSAITAVNISKDLDIIKTNLDLFYRIMDKLAAEESSAHDKVAVVEPVIPDAEEVQTLNEEDDFVLDFKEDANLPDEITDVEEVQTLDEEDDFVLDFKEEILEEDANLPDKVALLELADDDSLAIDIIEEEPVNSTQVVQVSYSKELSAKAIGLDMQTFEELFGDYIRDSRDISSHIHKALAKNNFEKCAKEARILKAMSDSIQIKEFTSELESLINLSDKNEMIKAIEKIDNVIEQISH